VPLKGVFPREFDIAARALMLMTEGRVFCNDMAFERRWIVEISITLLAVLQHCGSADGSSKVVERDQDGTV
jgi:hypothetical protein